MNLLKYLLDQGQSWSGMKRCQAQASSGGVLALSFC